MAVTYEWDCETAADGESAKYEDGERLDHAHGDSYKEVIEWAAANPPDAGTRHEIVLVRDDDEGRSWAYMEDGKLPTHFSDANGCDTVKVPARFHEEVLRIKLGA